MTIDVKIAAELLKNQDNILILSHDSPDGDTLGCGFALAFALKSLGKNVRHECNDEIPNKFLYMCEGLIFDDFEPSYIVAVDVADFKLLGDNLSEKYMDKVDLCIDHHISHKSFAKNLLLEEAGAACEIVFKVIDAMEVPISKSIGQCLYTGITTDTGCFRYSNTTPQTLNMAARLIECGAENAKINQMMFETKTKTYLNIERLALETLEFYFDEQCSVMCITQDMFMKSGSNESECDGISALPRQIEGVLVGVTIREKNENVYKISVRTNSPVNAMKICERMGGGGHQRASGCTVLGTLSEVKEILLNNIKDFI